MTGVWGFVNLFVKLGFWIFFIYFKNLAFFQEWNGKKKCFKNYLLDLLSPWKLTGSGHCSEFTLFWSRVGFLLITMEFRSGLYIHILHLLLKLSSTLPPAHFSRVSLWILPRYMLFFHFAHFFSVFLKWNVNPVKLRLIYFLK